MSEERKYVFTDGIDTYAKTKKELEDEHGKETDPVEIEKQNNDVQLAYRLAPLRRLEVIGKSKDQIYAVVDLKNQDKTTKANPAAVDADLLRDDKALEVIDGKGFSQVHNLYSYNAEAVEMLKALDDNKDVSWKAEKDLYYKPAKGGDVKSLELPPAKVETIQEIERETSRKRDQELSGRDLDGDGDVDETDQLIKNERMTPSRYEKNAGRDLLEKRREAVRRGIER